ncbi:MAG: glycosyltransferase family 2 protein, partial [Helicobacter sp.]|nr:glycosyltransferase family 2 protein [Helicobacter sp.]
LGEYLLILSDDEYLYNAKHLRSISDVLHSYEDIDFVMVDQGLDYGGIVIFPENVHYPLPKTFVFEELTDIQKQALQDKIKVIYRQDFVKQYDFFNANKQDKADVCFEVSYYEVYKYAKMAYVSGVAHIFGVTPNARRKYISFFNWIVSSGMSVYGERDRERFYQRLSGFYSDYSMALNAFFDWGGDSLAKSLSYFSDNPSFPTYLKKIAQNYQECFQERLEEEYRKFNASLLSEEERECAIRDSKNVVIYGDGTWRGQIEKYLKARGKTIAFIVDDYKLGAIKAEDMIWQDTPYDLIFIASASPKIIYEVFKKLKLHNNTTQVATILVRDEI